MTDKKTIDRLKIDIKKEHANSILKSLIQFVLYKNQDTMRPETFDHLVLVINTHFRYDCKKWEQND